MSYVYNDLEVVPTRGFHEPVRGFHELRLKRSGGRLVPVRGSHELRL